MFPVSRPLRLALASVVGFSFLVFGVQAPAVAAGPVAVAAASAPTDLVDVGDASLVDEPQLTVSGDIRVVVVDETASSRTEYAVATPSGETVSITGDLPEGVATGDAFVGTVAIPASVVDAVNASHDDQVEKSSEVPIDPSSAAGEQIVALAATAGPLQVVAATVEVTTVAAAATPRGHTIDVAIATGTTFSDSEVDALLAGVDSFWRSQSAGVITSVTRTKPIQRNVSPSCDQNNFWSAAAARFGKSPVEYWDNGRGEHLLVLTDSRCGIGLGTVGNEVHSGGLSWASVADQVDLHTVGHEFGHNLGLGHSNVHECAEPARAEGAPDQGCDDLEYEDYFDIMSGGFEACLPCITTNKLGALNASHKRTLGFLPAGSTRTITTTTTDVLQPASAMTGLRTLEVTDPVSQRVYQIEFRSGTGMDAGTFYATERVWGYELRMGLGVRVLTTKNDGGVPTSVAIAQALTPGRADKALTLKPAQTFTSETGALRVTVNAQTTSTATVTVELLPVTVDQIQGDDRYSTAVAIAKKGYTTADVVYVATGANYPDALSAAPAAVKEDGPLLLTPSDYLPDSVRTAIEALDPDVIVVVGGEAAVSPAVFAALQSTTGSPTVDRIAGADRFATARAVVDRAFGDAMTEAAYVATGNNFPDALSAAAAAGSLGAPVILVNGPQPAIDKETEELFDKLGVTKTVIAGGTSAVSIGMQASLGAISTVSRVAGDDRYTTSLAINNAVVFRSPATVFLATGTQFPDALAGAALAGMKGAPLYVVQPSCIPFGTRSAILSSADTMTLLGGPNALGAGVMALRSC